MSIKLFFKKILLVISVSIFHEEKIIMPLTTTYSCSPKAIKLMLKNGWEKLQNDTKFHTLSFLSQKERGCAANVNKEMKELAKETGGSIYRYLTEGQRLLNAYLRQQHPLPDYVLPSLKTPCALIALGEKLVTFDHIKEWETWHIEDLFIPFGLIALREKLILPEQVKTFHATFLPDILTSNGLTALREKLFTIAQGIRFNNLRLVLTDRGLTVLRDKALTPEQIAQLPDQIEVMLTAQGLAALRTGRLNFEQIKHLNSFALGDLLEVSLEQTYKEYMSDYKQDLALKEQARRFTL